MPLDGFVSGLDSRLLVVLAINIGLVILLFWFAILWLMLREFRKFTHQLHTHQLSEDERQKHQASFDNAINDANDNRETLTTLLQIQHALEAQISELQASNAPKTEQDLEAIDDLNNKLSKSHQLIKKLKNDLDSSVRRLKKAKVILLEKDDTVESLRQQKEEIEKQFEHLEKEYIMISESGGFQDVEQDFRKEKQKLVETIEDYKRQLSAQPGTGASEEATKELKQKLVAMQKQMQHQAKEKEFIEAKYLELVEKTKPAD